MACYKPGTPEHGSTKHGILPEQRNIGGTIGIPWNRRTGEHQWNNGTTKQQPKNTTATNQLHIEQIT